MSDNANTARSFRDEIRKYSQQVRWNRIECGVERCPHCGAQPEESSPFSRHGTRSRRIRLIVGAYVQTVGADVPRWRCSDCKRTFTEYPPFLIPQKQFSVPQMTTRALDYVNKASFSYRRASQNAGQPLFYQQEDTKVDECASIMAHTSLFHWVTTLGTRVAVSDVDVRLIAPWKFTTSERKVTLLACRAYCQTIAR